MTIMFWVAIGSACGGLSRFALLQSCVWMSLGLPTLLVNSVGCFAAGFLATQAASSQLLNSQAAQAFLMIGFLGSFTTFSAFSLDMLQTFKQELWLTSVMLFMANSVGCLLAAMGGSVLSQVLAGQLFH